MSAIVILIGGPRTFTPLPALLRERLATLLVLFRRSKMPGARLLLRSSGGEGGAAGTSEGAIACREDEEGEVDECRPGEAAVGASAGVSLSSTITSG